MSKNSPQQNYQQLMQWLPTIKQVSPKKVKEDPKRSNYYKSKEY